MQSNTISKEIKISEIKDLLKSGKKIRVKSKAGFVPITDYVEKGILPTYEVILENGNKIKVSERHRFFTNSGWEYTNKLKPDITKIYCDDNQYSTVLSVKYIGEYPIVDITVDDESHSYFGNGMLNHNTGKSLLAAHILSETQKKGGVAVLIDTENSVSMEFYDAIGLDISKLLYVQADSVEEIFQFVETIIEKVRKSEKDKLVTIVVDSVANASTKSEIAGDFDKTGFNTDKSIILGQAMRKITNMIGEQKISIIFTNQLRMKLNAMAFADPWITPGGKAIPYAASVIIRLNKIGQIKVKEKGKDRVIGVKVKAELKKNRVGPPFTTAEFEIYFDSGIDNYGSWLKVMKDNDIIALGGAWYTYVSEETGEEFKFQSKDFKGILESNPDVKDEIYRKICNATISKYKSTLPDLDEMELDESTD